MFRKNNKILILMSILNLLIFPVTANATNKNNDIDNLDISYIYGDDSDTNYHSNDMLLQDDNILNSPKLDSDTWLDPNEYKELFQNNNQFNTSRNNLSYQELMDLEQSIMDDSFDYENTSYDSYIYNINLNEYDPESLDAEMDETKIEKIKKYNENYITNYNEVLKKIYNEIEILKKLERKEYKDLTFEEVKVLDQYLYTNTSLLIAMLKGYYVQNPKTQKRIELFLEKLGNKNIECFEEMKDSFKKVITNLKDKQKLINRIRKDYISIINNYESKKTYYEQNISNLNFNLSLYSYIMANKDYLYTIEHLTFINHKFKEIYQMMDVLQKDLATLRSYFKKKKNNKKPSLEEIKIYNFYKESYDFILQVLFDTKNSIDILYDISYSLKKMMKMNKINYKYCKKFITTIDAILDNVTKKNIEQKVVELYNEINRLEF